MSWLDDQIAAVIAASTTTVSPPRAMGYYAFDAGVELAMEQLINQFAPLVGYTRVVVDSHLDAGDAERMVRIQRMLFSDYTCDSSAKKAGLAKLETELNAAATEAAAEKGITVTPEQMWCADNQTAITTKLPAIWAGIGNGQIKKCSSIPWLWIGLGVGVYAITRRSRR